MALYLFITGCTSDGILELQEETFEESLTSESVESLSAKEDKFHFNTSLSVKNMVWHVDLTPTKAVGEAIIKISKDETMVHFKVNVANIVDVTKAHFHLKPSGKNGSVVSDIYTPDPAPHGRINGLLAEGTIMGKN